MWGDAAAGIAGGVGLDRPAEREGHSRAEVLPAVQAGSVAPLRDASTAAAWGRRKASWAACGLLGLTVYSAVGRAPICCMMLIRSGETQNSATLSLRTRMTPAPTAEKCRPLAGTPMKSCPV